MANYNKTGRRAKVAWFVPVALVALMTSLSASAQNLACESVTDCSSKASCGSAGTPSNCKLNCENGAIIYCPIRGGDIILTSLSASEF
jgi:hypothetical protein